MRVRLTRKFAERINGVDLSGHQVNEVFDVPPRDARLLFAEEWAIAERRAAERRAAERPYGLDRRVHDVVASDPSRSRERF